MPDLLAGTTVNALDTPPTVSDTEDGAFGFNSTTYGIDADSGSYVDCGVAFTAPTTGRVVIHTNARLNNDTAALGVSVTPVVRDGSTVGSGTVIVAADDSNRITNTGTSPLRMGVTRLVTGLTPGDSYNVRLEHKVSGGNGDVRNRHVIVAPAT